jgi:hypothetical protein
MSEPQGAGYTGIRESVINAVSENLAEVQGELDAMAPSQTKSRLEEMLRHTLVPSSIRVQEAQGAANTLIAARVYAGLLFWFVEESKPATKHHPRFQALLNDLNRRLGPYIEIELLIDDRLVRFAEYLVQRLDTSTTVTMIGELIAQLRSYNENLGDIVTEIQASNAQMASSMSDTGNQLAAIHHTLHLFTEEMVGPVTRRMAGPVAGNGKGNSGAPAAGEETAGGVAAAPVFMGTEPEVLS